MVIYTVNESVRYHTQNGNKDITCTVIQPFRERALILCAQRETMTAQIHVDLLYICLGEPAACGL